ncbi:hypothetical protein PsAD13_03735 [Pseudovibrio sp. Ad13]|uniref:hypothetical protein n=1 Tax=Pseudovibrio sp. Ad13 TaxID=989396 RepID=UPI0007AE8632|nr:hypothetical protein [Pseudovibrio sp. Ad13]KZK82181.1 hypothetical protein PsAD13_03735 [Pseudovibrio sp. Ad13]
MKDLQDVTGMPTKKHKAGSFLNNSKKALSGSLGAVPGIVTQDPVLLLGGAAAASVVVDIAADFCDRVLSPKQRRRSAEVLSLAIEDMSCRIENGEKPREDFEFREGSSDLLESILLKAQNEVEQKKLVHLAKVYSNIEFDDELLPEDGLHLVSVVSELSYRQLCLIKLLKGLENGKHAFLSRSNLKKTPRLATLLKEYQQLETLGLFDYTLQGGYLGDQVHFPSTIELSALGDLIFKYGELMSLDQSEVQTLEKALTTE